jgi:membrane-bound metal-dependent hydrolase YbcI (DUF457 family)
MPQAVTHVLIALIIVSLIRDFYISKKDKQRFPLHYVLIAGIAGLLPDIDIIAYYGLSFFGFTIAEVHRTFTHTLFLPILLLIIAGLTWKIKSKELGKHHLTFHMIFLMLALGSIIHLFLDAFLSGRIMPIYPFSQYMINFSVVSYIPANLQSLFFPSLDAILLVLWLVYMEYRHKISDFI